MLKQSDFYAALPDTAMSEFFRNAGDRLADESAVLENAISSILASDGHITHKSIILWLVHELETTNSVVNADILRKTLEIVVGYTMDDI
ncbi:biofilm development regulator YmgB/AriR family protein [Citrobacter amalonaticus]|uniref:biofilm development regulator YmgB/AriR family protein n=1 Tax=Citrobacter amalonaticus TaxID=35703 RepID=UPI00300C67B0